MGYKLKVAPNGRGVKLKVTLEGTIPEMGMTMTRTSSKISTCWAKRKRIEKLGHMHGFVEQPDQSKIVAVDVLVLVTSLSRF